MKKNKIWIVMEGEFCDIDVEYVFSSKKKAQEYINKVGNERRWIEELDIDDEESLKDKYYNMFRVTIVENSRTGKTRAKATDFSIDRYKDYFSIKNDLERNTIWTFYIESDRADKATKIASERLMQLKALPYTWRKDYDIQLIPQMYNYFTKELVDIPQNI